MPQWGTGKTDPRTAACLRPDRPPLPRAVAKYAAKPMIARRGGGTYLLPCTPVHRLGSTGSWSTIATLVSILIHLTSYLFSPLLLIMASYTSQVDASNKRFQAELKRAKTRQAVLNVYWKHKKDHEKLLAKHLKEELALVNKIKSKIAYR